MYLNIRHKSLIRGIGEITVKCTCTDRVIPIEKEGFSLKIGNELEILPTGIKIKASRFFSLDNVRVSEYQIHNIISVLDESYNIQQPQYLPIGKFENGEVRVFVKNGAQGFVPRYLASHNNEETFVYAENTGVKTKFPEVIMPLKKTELSANMEWAW